MLIRGASLASGMSHYLIEQIQNTPNIEVWTRTSVAAVHGESRLTGITIQCLPSGETKELPATSLFIFIGAQPRTEWLGTGVPGIFAAGDVRHGSVKRVASGVGEGAVVVQFMHQYLAKVQ